MYTGFIMILSIVLAGLSIISLVKNFLINFNVSDNGWKTVLLAILIATCLFTALFSYTEAITIQHIKVMESTSQSGMEEIEKLKSLIPIKTISITISICIGYIAYFLQMLLIKNIRRNIQKLIDSSADRRWQRKV